MFTLYADAIFFIFVISSGNFKRVNSFTSPTFSIVWYKVFLSASCSTNIRSTDSFNSSLFFSIYLAIFSYKGNLLSSFFFFFVSDLLVFFSFLNNPVFLAIISFLSKPNAGVSKSEISSSAFVSSI